MWAWKGLRSMSSVFREITGSISNGRMLVLDTSGCRFKSCLSEMLWGICCNGFSMSVCDTEGEGSIPSVPISSLARVVIGRVCKTLFHGFKSHRDVQKYRHIAQWVRATLWYGGGHRFKSCYAYFFFFKKLSI